MKSEINPNESIEDAIIRTCAQHYGTTKAEMLSHTRSYKHGAVQARFMACWIMRTKYNVTYERIAKVLCRSDHTTVLYAVRKMNDFFSVYAEIRNDRQAILSELGIKTLFES